MNAAVTRADARTIEFFGCAGDYAELGDAMLARASAVLASGQVLGGPDVERFERRVSAMAGRAYAVAVGSGTDALFFALLGAGIGPGDEVLVPAVTFVASASAIMRTGARPIFVDIGEDFSIDLEHATTLLSPATRAMVVVHLFGAVSNPDPLNAYAARHGLLLIEDYAQSFGASFADHAAGSFGVAGATSFDPTKVLGAPGSGGALVTDDAALAERARRLRLHGKGSDGFVELGYNSQLPSLAAAILDLKLDYHPVWTQRRAAIAKRYMDGLSDLPLAFPTVDSRIAHVWHKFVLMTDRRDELAAALAADGIPFRIHYDRTLADERLFGAGAVIPRARTYVRRTLSLPIHSHLDNASVDRVIQAIRTCLG